jgi:hypothetical protein
MRIQLPGDGHRTSLSGPNAVAPGPGMVISNGIADTLGAERLGRATGPSDWAEPGHWIRSFDSGPANERSIDRPQAASEQPDAMSPSRANTETDPAP